MADDETRRCPQPLADEGTVTITSKLEGVEAIADQGTVHVAVAPSGVGRVIHATASAIVGPTEPRPETRGEELGVLALVFSGVTFGYGVGSSIDGVRGGVGGAAIGGVAASVTLRWTHAREHVFRFARWVNDDKRR